MRKLIDPKTNSEKVLPDVKGAKSSRSQGESSAKSTEAKKFRDINEDDDGYHPYADGPVQAPTYEEDPWR